MTGTSDSDLDFGSSADQSAILSKGFQAAVAADKANESIKDAPSPSNNKRKLEEDVEAGILAQKKPRIYNKHDIHWLSDGNVLLQIEKTRFKLHKTRLASQSSWFKSLFDRRAGILQTDDFQYKEVDRALSTAEIVDGLDLFYLDLPDAPSASDFAELLTCMDKAITYLKKYPSVPTINSILQATYFFMFYSYSSPLEAFILQTFPDKPEKIAVTITPHAAEAVNLGRDSPNLRSIIRCAFYQLARRPPASGSADALEDLPKKDLILLLNVQKELILTWESITAIVEPTCDEPKCVRNRTPNTATAWRKHNPFDPLLGISKLIRQDWSSKGFCSAKEKEIITKLKAERSKIWANLETWLELED